MTIQWYPGHMAKAKREVQENLKKVDFVIELIDARVPLSSQNPMLQEILGDKKKMLVLMKKDLADPELTDAWLTYFNGNDRHAIAIDANDKNDIRRLIQQAEKFGGSINQKREDKGVNPRALRAMIIGIPNVGKSTLINRLANKRTAEVGDKPGVTKKQAWIKVKGAFELLDTPGILWPKFEDQTVGLKLAATGSIKDTLLHMDDIAVFLLKYLTANYPDFLMERYGLDISDEDTAGWFDHIGRKRGCIQSGGHVDYEKTASVIVNDFRDGKIGRITLDQIDD